MLEAYFALSGRMRRRGYIGYSLLLWLVLVVLIAFGSGFVHVARFPQTAKLFVTVLVCAFWIWAVVALKVKRLHDIGWPGWHCLWMVALPTAALFAIGALQIDFGTAAIDFKVDGGLPTVALLVFLLVAELIFWFATGSSGRNDYGYPPGSS